MRTIRTKVYKFNELTETGKQNAIEKWRNNHNDMDIYSDEIIDSIKAMAEVFNLEFGREYTNIRTGHIEDTILELKGIRLYKYIVNNYYNSLFTPAYIKTVDRELYCKQFVCEVFKGTNGKHTHLSSKLRKDNNCVLTGVCYDMDILDPIYKFLENPDSNTTFADLFSEIESAITKVFRNTEEWVNSEEYIKETIEANEYEFTADGRMI